MKKVVLNEKLSTVDFDVIINTKDAYKRLAIVDNNDCKYILIEDSGRAEIHLVSIHDGNVKGTFYQSELKSALYNLIKYGGCRFYLCEDHIELIKWIAKL